MLKTCVAEQDQTLTIPKGCFVVHCNFDSENPTCTLSSETSDGFCDTTIPVPKALAYFLSTHSCGSKKMREMIEKDAKYCVRMQILESLGIEKEQ